MKCFDAIVIGAGQAGTPLSVAPAWAGNNTAPVERQHVGRTYDGPTPSRWIFPQLA
jgi:pyruvate/2-oxoglutarate dehydrogenase complex dihydrolipoamide dehydrogenase (E3) component